MKWVVTDSQKQVTVFPSLKDLFFGGFFGGGGAGVGVGVCQKMEIQRGWSVKIAG